MSKFIPTYRRFVFFIFLMVFAGCNAALNMTPYLFVSHSEIDFGKVLVDSTKTKEFEIQNHSTKTLVVGDFQFKEYSSTANGDEFEITEILNEQDQKIDDISRIRIPRFSKITVRIGFTPTSLESIDAILSFEHNDGKLESPHTVGLKGTGVESCIAFSPKELKFGRLILMQMTTEMVKVHNISMDDITITNFYIDPSSGFAVADVYDNTNQVIDDVDLPFTLESNDYVSFEIRFIASEAIEYNSSLVFEYVINGENYQTELKLSGTGVENEAPKIVKIETSPVRIGEEAIIKIIVYDPNESLDNLTVAVSIDLSPVKFIDMIYQGTTIGNEFVYKGTVVIPNNPSYYGYRTITAHVTDVRLASDTDYAFQMIYTGSLIEVGAAKPFTTIKPAVAVAVDGDCVLVHDGVYSSSTNTVEENRDISFDGKKIIVTSASGHENTTIQVDGAGGNFHRAFVCLNGESLDTIVHGLTIKGGFMRHEYGGGAIVCVDSELTVLHCLFKSNVGTCDSNGYAYGGVISAINSNLTVRKCNFIDNNALV